MKRAPEPFRISRLPWRCGVSAAVLLWCLWCLWCPRPATALGIDEFERQKQDIDASIERLLDDEFAVQRAQVASLGEPCKVGDQVDVRIRHGAGFEVVSGRFNGLVRGGRYAKISSTTILLTDLAPEDRDRLRSGVADPKQRQAMMAARREELDKEIDRRRHQLRRHEYTAAGFSPDFFAQYVVAGSQIVPLSELGHERILVSFALEDQGRTAALVFRNGSGQPLAAAVALGKQPVAASTGAAAPGAAESWIQDLEVGIERDDLGRDPARSLATRLRLICAHGGCGVWELRPTANIRRKVDVVRNQGKPMRVLRMLLEMAIPPEALTPAEDAFSLRRVRGVPQPDFEALAEAGREYQLALTRRAAEPVAMAPPTDPVAVAAPEPAPVPAAPADPGVRSLQDALAVLEKPELGYTWMVPGADGASGDGGLAVLSNMPMQDYESPDHVGDLPIMHYSRWCRVRLLRQAGQNLDFPEYRILIAKGPARLRFFFQFRGTFASLTTKLQHLVLHFAFKSGDKATELASTYIVVPEWAGRIYGTHEVSLAALSRPLSDIRVWISEQQPGTENQQ